MVGLERYFSLRRVLTRRRDRCENFGDCRLKCPISRPLRVWMVSLSLVALLLRREFEVLLYQFSR